MSEEFLSPGFDPSGITEIAPEDLEVLINQSAPTAKYAWLIVSTTTPDVIATPALTRFHWIHPTTYAHKVYDGASWIPFPYALQSIRGGAIIDGTLDLAALLIPPGQAGKILQVNVGGTAFQFVTTLSTIANGSFPLLKLALGPANTVLFSDGAMNQWKIFDSAFLLALIADKSIAVGKLIPGVKTQVLTTVGEPGFETVQWLNQPSFLTVSIADAGKFLTNNGTTISWGLIGASVIQPGADGQILMTVGSAATWKDRDFAYGKFIDTRIPFPVALQSPGTPGVAAVTRPHGLGAVPKNVDARVICRVTHGSYVAEKTCVMIRDFQTVVDVGIFMLAMDDVNVYITRRGSASQMVSILGNFDVPGNWDLQVLANL